MTTDRLIGLLCYALMVVFLLLLGVMVIAPGYQVTHDHAPDPFSVGR